MFLKDAGMAAGLMVAAPLLGNIGTSDEYDFPLMDLHVHTTDQFTMDMIMKIAEERKVKFGIVEHPAAWAIK